MWRRWGGIVLLETEEKPSLLNWKSDLLYIAIDCYVFHLRSEAPSKLFRYIFLNKFWQTKYHRQNCLHYIFILPNLKDWERSQQSVQTCPCLFSNHTWDSLSILIYRLLSQGSIYTIKPNNDRTLKLTAQSGPFHSVASYQEWSMVSAKSPEVTWECTRRLKSESKGYFSRNVSVQKNFFHCLNPSSNIFQYNAISLA